MTPRPPIVVPERRGVRSERLWASSPELLIAASAVLAGINYLIDGQAFRQTAIGVAPEILQYVWLIGLLITGGIAVLIGQARERPRLARTGLVALSLAFLAYAVLLLPNRGGQAGLTTLMFLSSGVYLMARANRWGRV